MRYVAGLILAFGLTGWGGLVTSTMGALAAEALPRPTGDVLLVISGNIEQTNAPGEARFDRAMLESLGQESFTTASQLSDKPQVFEGVPLRAILDRVGARGTEIGAKALNDFEAAIPLEDMRFGPLVAMKADGQPLKMRDKGPLWIVYPRDRYKELNDMRYDSRWVWQLHRLHVQ